MTFAPLKHAIGVFPNHQEAEYALHQLKDASFSFDKVSVIAKNADSKLRGADITDPNRNLASEGAKVGAVTGGATAGLVGLFEGLAVVTIPGMGPALALGTVLANTLLAGGIGAAAGGLLGGLIGWGIPEEQAKFYYDRVSQGDYLLIVEGTEHEIRRAETILNSQSIQQWRVYDAARSIGHSQMSVSSCQPDID